MSNRLPTYFISHGGGPWPYLDGPFRRTFDQLEQSLLDIRKELNDAPSAVLVISGHWEENGFAMSSGEQPGMVYDYSGFPEHTYHIRYKAPGSPELAARVQELLGAGGVEARLDPDRGYDPGTFSIMKPLYPGEDIPLVQLSIDRSYDPALHLKLGRLLAPLRDEAVLIIGSKLIQGDIPVSKLDSYAPHALAALRIMTSLLMIQHSTMKFFAFPGPLPMPGPLPGLATHVPQCERMYVEGTSRPARGPSAWDRNDGLMPKGA